MTRWLLNASTICFAFFHSSLANAHDDDAQARYLGNEGVMVVQGGTKILFDPLYESGLGYYQEVPDGTRDEIINGIEAFDGVTALFVSHMHADHFSAGDSVRFLKANPNVRFVAPAQAVEMMRELVSASDSIFDRVTEIRLSRGDPPLTVRIGEVVVEAIRIPHSGWPQRAEVANIVYRVTLSAGATVMHMGDADSDDEHFVPYEEHWQARRTDLAFPPYWFLLGDEGRGILRDRINAKHAIGIHVPVEVPEDLLSSGGDCFSRIGETRAIK